MRYTDQTGRSISIPSTPKRIVSLVPSQTELLYSLGLTTEVVGITKFCVRPTEWFRTKPRIGGTKDISIEAVKALRPDLIIAGKEENVQEQIETLAKDFPVWVSDVATLKDAGQMIESIGTLIDRPAEASALAEAISRRFAAISHLHQQPLLNCCYLIWKAPYMTVGGDTFIGSMMACAGLHNMYDSRQRYPVVTMEQLLANDCRYLLLSSEPYPFKQTQIAELQAYLPQAKIIIVDGEMFSWYGSRLLQSPAYFVALHEQLQGGKTLMNGRSVEGC